MNKNECGKGIIERIVGDHFINEEADITLISELLINREEDGSKITDDKMLLRLLNGTSTVLNKYSVDHVESYSELVSRLKKAILESDVIHDSSLKNKLTVKDTGIAIATIGNELITIGASSEKIIKDKIKNNDFTDDDIKAMQESDIAILIDSKLKDEMINYLNNKDKVKTSSNSNVKVTDKKALIQLLKDNRISFDILRTIIESGEITILELMDELDEKQFTHVLKELKKTRESKDADGEEKIKKCNCKKECDNHSSKVDSDKMNLVFEDVLKEILTESLQGLTGKPIKDAKDTITNKQNDLAKEAIEEDDITIVEDICRSRIKAGTATDEEILLAVKNGHLNPFFLDATIKHSDPKRHAVLCTKILEQEMPNSEELFKVLLDENLKELSKILNGK